MMRAPPWNELWCSSVVIAIQIKESHTKGKKTEALHIIEVWCSVFYLSGYDDNTLNNEVKRMQLVTLNDGGS